MAIRNQLNEKWPASKKRLMSQAPNRMEMSKLLREQLPNCILNLLHTAGEVGDRLGMPTYVVGGFVRDLLLGKENWDVDIVVEGDGIAYARQMAEQLKGTVKTHKRFLTASIKYQGGISIDIATARTEFYARPAALPLVEASSIQYDLSRRDFSINAMAIRINPVAFGVLVDHFNGLQDLKDRVVRILYALSFVDDPTRIFRAVRFEQRYTFHIETDTERYLKNAVKLDLVGQLSMPRIFAELMLILTEDEPLKALARLEAFGVLPWIHPSLKHTRQFSRTMEALWETFAFAVLFVEEPIDRQTMYLMALFEHLTLSQLDAMTAAYQFPRRTGELIRLQKTKGEQARKKLESLSNPKPSQIERHMRALPLEVLLFELARIGLRSSMAKYIRKYITHWRLVRPSVTGSDLKKIGYVPGPQFEKMLDAVRAARLDGQLHTHQEEVGFLRQHYPLPLKR